MATNGCVEVLNLDTKKQLGIATADRDSNDDCCSGCNRTFWPAKLADSSYLARPKTQDSRTLTERFERPAHCFLSAITHMN